jgi:hypothetical protein
MSVPFRAKIFLGVLLAHVVVFSLIWIGFSAPGPRPPVQFTYGGSSLPEGEDNKNGLWQPTDKLILRYPEGVSSNYWAKFRASSKPVAH